MSDAFFEAFGFAAARACLFELKLRLLADNTPAISRHSLDPKLSKVLEHVLAEYAARLDEKQCDLLNECVRLRNKLLHAELSRVTGRLVNFGEELNRGQVAKIDLVSGEIQEVSKTKTQDGKIIGWVMESATSGAFAAGADVFFNGIVLLESLFVGAETAPPP